MDNKEIEQQRFRERKSLAGDLQPGDRTKYQMVAVEFWDYVEVVVMNEGFFDKITFLKKDGTMISTYWRREQTNPWTIKAATEMFDRLMEKKEKIKNQELLTDLLQAGVQTDLSGKNDGTRHCSGISAKPE